jgi:putative membrane protein
VKNHPIVNLLVRWLVLALGVILATRLVNGVEYDSPGSLLAVVVLMSLFNAFLKPLLVLFTLPFIVVTMGLGMVVINALLFLLVGRLVEGFSVPTFWAAFWCSVIVSLTNIIVSALLAGPKPPRPPGPPGPGGPARGRKIPSDVIDI